MKDSKKFKMFGALVFADILLLGSLFFVCESVFHSELKNSISSVVSLNEDYDESFILGRKNNNILKSIDNYFDNCIYMNDLMFTDNDKENLLDIVDNSNLINDYPNFEKSIKTLNKIENDINVKHATLDEKLNMISLREYIYSIYNHRKYVSTYNKLSSNKDIVNKMNVLKDKSNDNYKTARNYIVKVKDIVLFLKNHPNQFIINANNIQFYDKDLDNSFNYMLDNIK